MTTEQQLLKGWKKYNLFDICQPKQWKTIAVKDLKNEGYPVYGANGIIGFHNEFNHEKETLLIGCRGSCGEVHISQPKSYINGNAMCLDKLSDNISLHYLYYFLKGYNFKPIISGSTQPQITQIGLKKVEIPTPTLETQQAIVNKIESLFDEIDEGIGRLKTAAQQIQQYRQSLLKNAFNGELTKEWRSKHADTLPSENELLAQIQTTREQHHAQQLADWQTAVSQWEQNGKEGKKPSKPSSLSSVNILSKDSELPENWLLTEAESICDFITKGTTPPKNELFMKSGEVPFLKVYNLTKNGKLDFTIEPTFVLKETHNNFLNRSKVYPNDILMNIVGPPLGKVSLVPDDYPEWNINQAIVIYRSIFVHSKFLANYLLAEKTIKLMSSQAKTTAGQHNLTLEICRNLPIPVCSLAEQTQIVAILESKLTACDQLAAELAKQLKQAELLKQAVLKAAFSGSLLDK